MHPPAQQFASMHTLFKPSFDNASKASFKLSVPDTERGVKLLLNKISSKLDKIPFSNGYFLPV